MYLKEVAAELDKKTASWWEQPSQSKPIPYGAKFDYSLDNARVHKAAYSEETVAWPDKPTNGTFGVVQPPPYSPDLHKVIEHVHGTICSAFRQEIQAMGPAEDINTYFAKLKQLFYQKTTAASVQKDCQSLKQTIQEVIKLEGAWPAAQFR